MLKKCDVKSVEGNVFSMIGDQWMLITAGTADHYNTMTASWGGLGVLWGKNVATCYIRPQHYTYEFAEESDYFTLCFFGEEYRKALTLCGTKSGRDIDKRKECGFTLAVGAGNTPYFQEAELVLVCRKKYWQDLDPTHFMDENIEQHYPCHDYHRMYIGEIVEAYQKE